jgi:hypothetical protein
VQAAAIGVGDGGDEAFDRLVGTFLEA